MRESRTTLIPVTAIVSTKNEELAIERCLVELGAFERVVVVDSKSTDKTPDLVRSLGHELVEFSWDGKYPKKKQWCLDNLHIEHDWVLFVDADERPSPELLSEIAAITRAGRRAAHAYDIPLSYVFSGRTLRHGHTVVKRALLRKTHAYFPVVNDLDAPGMGELEGHYQPVVKGRVGRTKGRLIHDDPDPVSSWISRHNKYSDWEAYLRVHPETLQSVRAVRSRQGQVFDATPAKPLVFFLYTYLVKRGFLDGRAGFDYAVALAFYYWLIGLKTREASETE